MKIIFWIARICGWLVIAFGVITGFFAAMAPGMLEANPALALQYPHLGEAANQGLLRRLWFPVSIVFAGALISGLAADGIKKGQAVTGWVSVGLACFFALGVAILSSIGGQADAPVQIPLEIDEAGRLTLDGRLMTSNPTVEEIALAIGMPTRTQPAEQGQHAVWDHLGLTAYTDSSGATQRIQGFARTDLFRNGLIPGRRFRGWFKVPGWKVIFAGGSRIAVPDSGTEESNNRLSSPLNQQSVAVGDMTVSFGEDQEVTAFQLVLSDSAGNVKPKKSNARLVDQRRAGGSAPAELSPGSHNVSRPDDPDNVRLADLMREAESRQGFQSEKTIFSVNSGSIDRLGPPSRHQDLGQAIPMYAVKVTGERAEFARSGDLTGWISEFERDSQRGYGTLTGGPRQCEGIPVYNGRFKLRQTVINGVTAFRIKWIADQRCAIWTVDPNTCELIRCARRNFKEIEGAKGNFLVIGRTPAERLHQVLVDGG